MKKIIVIALFYMLLGLSPAYAKGVIQDGLCKIYKGPDAILNTLAYYNKALQRDGVVFEYYYNGLGDIAEQFWYKEGQPDGVARQYYENGQIKREVEFKEGKIVFLKEYNDRGEVDKIKNF